MKSSAPFISIIIPTFNRGNFLLDSINQILDQNYDLFEIIVVNDGSTDATSSILATIENKQVIHINQENKGVSSARNHGAMKARGSYLVFFDDDDKVSFNWLNDFALVIVGNKFPDVVYCGMRIFKTSSIVVDVLPSKEAWRLVMAGSFMIKKTFFDQIGGYDEQLSYGENTELFFRIRATDFSYASTDNLNFYYYASIIGGSKNLQNIIKSNKLILERHDALFNETPLLKKYFLRVVGVSLLRLRKYRESRKYLIDSYLLNPYELKALARLIISYIPILSKRIYK